MGLYAEWMYRWETALTTRDTNRIVRPLDWGFDWLKDANGDLHHPSAPAVPTSPGHSPESARMVDLNQRIIANSKQFFGYNTPQDFRLERRYPELFPTNVRPETLQMDTRLRAEAQAGQLEQAEFLRFTSAVATPFPENDQVNARWYPASRKAGPRRALIVMPQWNADAFSHNALCRIFNRFGISCLRLSKPYHDIRRPAHLERSDYACSSNVGRTISACRQAVVDVRSCLDWLESQGYQQFGILGTSLGSCYAFIAAAHDPRLQICAFNHASTWFGDVVWTGQSTRHIRSAFQDAGLSEETTRAIFTAISPSAYMQLFAENPKRVLVVHAKYDLTFLERFSLDVLSSFKIYGVEFVSRVLPCGHYTTGETPYKFLDAWYLSSFIHHSFGNGSSHA